MNKRFLWLILALTAAAALFFIGRNVLADSAGNPFSGESQSNIGAWYDETWLASGYYNLEVVGAGPNYSYTDVSPDPDPTHLAPFPIDSPDIVVTEWWVTGHVHFSSSGL